MDTKFILLLCSVIIAILPLAVKLYNTIKELSEEKNWPKLVGAVATYMAEAEALLAYGVDRKSWVMAMVQVTAEQLNYTLSKADLDNLSQLIDELCVMSKSVNVN